jgi:hypothetical protein
VVESESNHIEVVNGEDTRAYRVAVAVAVAVAVVAVVVVVGR